MGNDSLAEGEANALPGRVCPSSVQKSHKVKLGLLVKLWLEEGEPLSQPL